MFKETEAVAQGGLKNLSSEILYFINPLGTKSKQR